MATSLNDYIIVKLSQMATYLEWTAESTEVDIIVEDTIKLLGLASEAASTNIVALRTVAMYVAWRSVMYAISTDYTYSADKAKYNRSDMYEASKMNYKEIKKEAFQYLPSGGIGVGVVTYEDDPYKESDITELSTRRRI